MTATCAESHVPPTHAADARGRCAPANNDAIVLLLYGDEHVNLALADELELDGYEVRRASDTAKLHAVRGACEVELVIFGRATRRGAGLDVLRKVRARRHRCDRRHRSADRRHYLVVIVRRLGFAHCARCYDARVPEPSELYT
jgi:hypothetical protein